MSRPLSKIDQSWTLFLDRDGVINRKIDHDYVRNPSQFEFLPGSLEALKKLSHVFGRIVVVTNQRGVGRGLMKEADLHLIHGKMLEEVKKAGGRIDGVYYCADISLDGSTHRKPMPGMGFDAKRDFPEIDFSRSVIAGDSGSDIGFGDALGMVTVYISNKADSSAHFQFASLADFAAAMG